MLESHVRTRINFLKEQLVWPHATLTDIFMKVMNDQCAKEVDREKD